MTYTKVGFSLKSGFRENSANTEVGLSLLSGFTKIVLTARFPLQLERGGNMLSMTLEMHKCT